MSITIAPSEDGKYIVLTVQGEITRASAMEYNLEAHALGRKLGIKRYLMDLRLSRNIETPLNGYHFAYNDMKKATGIDRSARVALLVSPGDATHDFIETVSRNSGLDVTLFRDYEEAVEHLLQE